MKQQGSPGTGRLGERRSARRLSAAGGMSPGWERAHREKLGVTEGLGGPGVLLGLRGCVC